MKKLISLIIISLLIFPTFVSADGMIHIEDPDMHYWRIHDEKQQLCAINYENGYQKMILAVDFDNMNKDQKGVWIFPVPAAPDRTVIDVVKGFPSLQGYDVERKVDETINEMFSVMRLSQIYTFPFFTLRYLMVNSNTESFGVKGLGGTVDGVTIHEHIVKYGVTTELVSTTNGEALYKHLTERKGLNLPDDSISVLDEYVGDDYSFVISWFSGSEKSDIYEDDNYYRDRFYDTVSVSLTFPTEKIYYPLKPTSVYGSKRIPAVIYVMGHVTPDLYPEIEMDSEVTYFIQNDYYPTEELKSFFDGEQRIEDLKYTKIKINPPSKYLTNDLWIESYAPPVVTMRTLAIKYQKTWGLFFFILSSCLASMFAGMIVFRKDRPSLVKFGLFGLWNFLTIIGFAIATLFMKTKRLELNLERKLRRRGLKIWDSRKISFIFLFSISFVIITILFQIILQYIF